VSELSKSWEAAVGAAADLTAWQLLRKDSRLKLVQKIFFPAIIVSSNFDLK